MLQIMHSSLFGPFIPSSAHSSAAQERTAAPCYPIALPPIPLSQRVLCRSPTTASLSTYDPFSAYQPPLSPYFLHLDLHVPSPPTIQAYFPFSSLSKIARRSPIAYVNHLPLVAETTQPSSFFILYDVALPFDNDSTDSLTRPTLPTERTYHLTILTSDPVAGGDTERTNTTAHILAVAWLSSFLLRFICLFAIALPVVLCIDSDLGPLLARKGHSLRRTKFYPL